MDVLEVSGLRPYREAGVVVPCTFRSEAGAHVAYEYVTTDVDTHQDTHTAAVIDMVGRVLGTEQFPADAAGYAASFGRLARIEYFVRAELLDGRAAHIRTSRSSASDREGRHASLPICLGLDLSWTRPVLARHRWARLIETLAAKGKPLIDSP